MPRGCAFVCTTSACQARLTSCLPVAAWRYLCTAAFAGCPAAARPQSNIEYWSRKLDGNTARDARHLAALQAQGWTTLVIWECETRNAEKLAALAQQVRLATGN